MNSTRRGELVRSEPITWETPDGKMKSICPARSAVFIDPSDVNTWVVTFRPFFANNPSSMAISPQWSVMSSTTPSLTWVSSGGGNAPVPTEADGETELPVEALGWLLGGVDAVPVQAANASAVTIPSDRKASDFVRGPDVIEALLCLFGCAGAGGIGTTKLLSPIASDKS
jgi:hypothetical protein